MDETYSFITKESVKQIQECHLSMSGHWHCLDIELFHCVTTNAALPNVLAWYPYLSVSLAARVFYIPRQIICEIIFALFPNTLPQNKRLYASWNRCYILVMPARRKWQCAGVLTEIPNLDSFAHAKKRFYISLRRILTAQYPTMCFLPFWNKGNPKLDLKFSSTLMCQSQYTANRRPV